MAFFDFLRKKERAAQIPKRAQDKAKADEAATHKKEEKGKKEVYVPSALKESRSAWRILRSPHVTEKATSLTANNQYTFKILGKPSKPEVKRSVEEIYNVHVQKVRKITVPGKERRRGRRIGWKPGYTKAIVTLRQGEKIEILPH